MDDDLQGLDDVTRELLSSAHELLQSDLDDDLTLATTREGRRRRRKFARARRRRRRTLILFAAFVAVSNVYVLFFRK